MLGFKSFEAAHNTLVGIELMHMIKKRQRVVEEGEEGRTAAAQFYALAAYSPSRPGQLPLLDLLSKICDTTLSPASPEVGVICSDCTPFCAGPLEPQVERRKDSA